MKILVLTGIMFLLAAFCNARSGEDYRLPVVSTNATECFDQIITPFDLDKALKGGWLGLKVEIRDTELDGMHRMLVRICP